MKCRHLQMALLSVALLALVGCSSEKQIYNLPPLPENPQFIVNAAVVKPFIGSFLEAGVFISAYTYDNYRYKPGELINRLQEMGMNRLYLDIRGYDRKFFGEELDDFLAAMKNADIPVWLVFSDEVVYEKRKFDKLFKRPGNLEYDPQLMKQLNEFIDSCDFHGIALILTPHINNHLRTRSLYNWSNTTYGIGGSNDMLLKASLNLTANIKTAIGKLPLAIVIPDFYQKHAEDGELSAGRIKDFAPFADQFIITAFAETLSQSISMVEAHLKEAAGLKRQIIVGLLASDHYSYQTPESIANGSFTVFSEDLAKITPKLTKRHEFGGITVFNYRGLEILLEKPE